MIQLSKRSDTFVVRSQNVGPIAVTDDERLASQFAAQTNQALALAGAASEGNMLVYRSYPTIEDTAPKAYAWKPSEIDLLNAVNQLNALHKGDNSCNLTLFPKGSEEFERVLAWCYDKRSR